MDAGYGPFTRAEFVTLAQGHPWPEHKVAAFCRDWFQLGANAAQITAALDGYARHGILLAPTNFGGLA